MSLIPILVTAPWAYMCIRQKRPDEAKMHVYWSWPPRWQQWLRPTLSLLCSSAYPLHLLPGSLRLRSTVLFFVVYYVGWRVIDRNLLSLFQDEVGRHQPGILLYFATSSHIVHIIWHNIILQISQTSKSSQHRIANSASSHQRKRMLSNAAEDPESEESSRV